MKKILKEWRKYLNEAKKHHFVGLDHGSDEKKRFNKEQERLEKIAGRPIVPTQLHGYPDNHPDLIDLPANRKYRIPGTNNWLILLEPEKAVPAASPKGISEPPEHPQAGDLPPMAEPGEHTIEIEKIKKELKKLKMPKGRVVWELKSFTPGNWKKVKGWPSKLLLTGGPHKIAWSRLSMGEEGFNWYQYNTFLRGWKGPRKKTWRASRTKDPRRRGEPMEGWEWPSGWTRSWWCCKQSFFRHGRVGEPSLSSSNWSIRAVNNWALAVWLPDAVVYFPRNEVLAWYRKGLRIKRKRRKLKRKLRKLEKL